jgi:hypothetical protein
MAPNQSFREGRFQPGQSGNPAGKKPGTRNRMTVLAEQIAADRMGRIAEAAAAKAEEGDARLCQFFLGRAIARPRGRSVELDLPNPDTAAAVVAAGAALFRAAAVGEVTPDEAQSLGALLDGQRRALETAELERRIVALETRFALAEEV